MIFDEETRDELTEYVIYCRKSTDEASGAQAQSLPDQIQCCLEYAKKNKIILKLMDSEYDFDSETEIKKNLNDSNELNRKIYKEGYKYYTITEQESAKKPGKRNKRKKLINYIKKGKIKGILSYSPDRQARNMLEGGELIDLVDKKLVNLKYTSFLFEDSPEGKMMLGIWFVFAKQYSDKLLLDSGRGVRSSLERGKALGVYKHGYFIDTNGCHRPHEINFGLIRQAFVFKLDNKSDIYIAERLKKNGYKRDVNGGSQYLSASRLGAIWSDTFYYGIFKFGNRYIDLKECNENYKQIITEDEYNVLAQRSRGEKKMTETGLSYKPFKSNFVKTEDNFTMSCYLPNIKRFQKKFLEKKEKNPDLKFQDVVEPHQIRFRCTKSDSKYKDLEISYDIIQEEILKFFKKFNCSNNGYNKYLKHKKYELSELSKENAKERKSLILYWDNLKIKKNNYISNSLGKNLNKEEENIYRQKVKDFDENIRNIEGKIEEIDRKENVFVYDLQNFINLFKIIPEDYESWDYGSQKNVNDIFFSSITIKGNKKVVIHIKDFLKDYFDI